MLSRWQVSSLTFLLLTWSKKGYTPCTISSHCSAIAYRHKMVEPSKYTHFRPRCADSQIQQIGMGNADAFKNHFLDLLTVSNGRPFVLTIKAASSDLECPVILLTQYLAIRGSAAPGFLLCCYEAVPVTRAQFNLQLKHALQLCSYNTDRYKSICFTNWSL